MPAQYCQTDIIAGSSAVLRRRCRGLGRGRLGQSLKLWREGAGALRLRQLRLAADLLLVSLGVLVLHRARDQREERVIAPDADIVPRHDARTALPHEDLAAVDDLPVVSLDAEHLRLAVTSVPGRTDALLVCHSILPW